MTYQLNDRGDDSTVESPDGRRVFEGTAHECREWLIGKQLMELRNVGWVPRDWGAKNVLVG